MADGSLSRRELLRRGGGVGAGALLAMPGAQGVRPDGAALTPTGLPDVYGAIGVRPLINARGTFTIISGSTMLPEVRAAMDAASRRYVHLDELTEAVGARLAALTKAEWGLVTAGCAAAITHATAACVTGGNPELQVRLPNLQGFAKDEVIIPSHSRNVYDAAVRVVGVRVLTVSTVAELEAALGPRSAMIYVFAGPNADASPLSLKAMAPIAKARGVPIFVDAAAEVLTIPNVHLQAGADLVGYSGGKCLRGPQSAGLLLGRKDLVQAAWVHSAPHHGPGRGYKVGKEEAMGMLAAVEAWVTRDHDAEWRRWTGWLEEIAARLKPIDAVTTEIVQPEGLSNRTPTLRVHWHRQALGIGGELVVLSLLEGQPRIAIAGGAARDPALTGVQVNPYMMAPGDAAVVGDALRAILSKRPTVSEEALAPPAADLSGGWDVEIRYAAATATHRLQLRQQGGEIDGAHEGDFLTRDLTGSIDGSNVRLRSVVGEETGDALTYTFEGSVDGDRMSGMLDMGEYLNATWTATRRASRRRRA